MSECFQLPETPQLGHRAGDRSHQPRHLTAFVSMIYFRDSSPGRWIDCSLQKCAEGSISSSLILLPHLNIPHHCFHRSRTAVVYSLHDPSQALRWHTCLRDFQRSTKSRSCLLPPDMPRRYRRVSDALTLTQWVMNSASSLTAWIQILRIKLTLGLTSTSLTARGQQSQDYRDRGETVKTLRTVTQPSLKAKQRSTKNRMPPTYLFFKKNYSRNYSNKIKTVSE